MAHLSRLPFSTLLLIWFSLVNAITAIEVTGATGGVNYATGERPSRQEISTFAASGPAYDLFILALRQLQSTNQSDPLSYFQIAGIHGYPRIPWDGVVGTGPYQGFCTHSAVVFPTWHRAYVALFEQVLWNIAQVIARTYPTALQDEYISAATTLRVPYWDWVEHPYLPDAASQPSVTITTPDGEATLSNPLYAYIFLDTPEEEGIPSDHVLANMTETVRWWNPDTEQSSETAADATLQANAYTIKTLVYELLTTATNYSLFSCVVDEAADGTNFNIENIHNGIHNFVGGSVGHMSYPELAAFDPIFYLHHANVDRLFAMWQVLNPNNYVVPTPNIFGSYYEPPGFMDSANSSLAPFHSDNGTTLHTSGTIRSTLALGYTYPELIDWNISAAALLSNLRNTINTLYNPSALNNSTLTNDSSTSTTVSPRQIPRSAVAAAAAFHDISIPYPETLHINNLPILWTISITHQRYAHPTPFVLDFFMGHPEPNPALRHTAPNLIGSHAPFTASNISAMFPGGAPEGLVRGHVSLSHMLAAGVSRGVLRDLSPAEVVPVLRELLRWRARGVEGGDVDVGCLKGLSVRVSSRLVTPADRGDEFPEYGEVEWWDVVTGRKVGGG